MCTYRRGPASACIGKPYCAADPDFKLFRFEPLDNNVLLAGNCTVSAWTMLKIARARPLAAALRAVKVFLLSLCAGRRS